MPFIKLDQQMLLENLYYIRSQVDITQETSKDVIAAIQQLVDLVVTAPQIEKKSQLPRIGGIRR